MTECKHEHATKMWFEEELSKVFNAWLKKHGLTPSFYEVVDVEAVEVQ